MPLIRADEQVGLRPEHLLKIEWLIAAARAGRPLHHVLSDVSLAPERRYDGPGDPRLFQLLREGGLSEAEFAHLPDLLAAEAREQNIDMAELEELARVLAGFEAAEAAQAATQQGAWIAPDPETLRTIDDRAPGFRHAVDAMIAQRENQREDGGAAGVERGPERGDGGDGVLRDQVDVGGRPFEIETRAQVRGSQPRGLVAIVQQMVEEIFPEGLTEEEIVELLAAGLLHLERRYHTVIRFRRR